MIDLLEILVAAGVIALSLRRGVLLLAASSRPRPVALGPDVPSVTVIVPARDEQAVVGHLLRACDALAYPADKLTFVLVCDGCTDETPSLFRAWSAGRSATRVLELPARVGKAAALNAGLQLATGTIVAVIDADLEPAPDFLVRLVPAFDDARVGAAAAYLHPANADDGLVARYAAVTSWVHQLITSAGKDRLGLNPPTLGAAAFRRSALDQMDGFPAAPAGVDVATSTMLIQLGWRTRFVVTAVASNTVVSRLADYWRQHVRWSRATLRLPSVARPAASAPWPQRLELLASSVGYADRILFVVVALGAMVGALPIWVPLLYLAVPALEVPVALFKARGVRAMPRFLLATVACFLADIVGSIMGVLLHLARRPYRWYHPRAVQREPGRT